MPSVENLKDHFLQMKVQRMKETDLSAQLKLVPSFNLGSQDYSILQKIIQDFLSEKKINFDDKSGDQQENEGSSSKLAKSSDREDLTSPKFWYEQLQKKDEELNKAQVHIKELNGQLLGHEQLSESRKARVIELEQKVGDQREEIHFLKQKGKEVE